MGKVGHTNLHAELLHNFPQILLLLLLHGERRGQGLRSRSPSPGDKGTTPHLLQTPAASCAFVPLQNTVPGAPGAHRDLPAPLLPAWLHPCVGN